MQTTVEPKKAVGDQPQKNLMMAFATPIGRFQFTGADSVNQELRRLILDREKSRAGEGRRGAWGWHSTPDLLMWPSLAIDPLRDWIARAALDMISAMPGPAQREGKMSIAAWAYVARRGNYQKLQNAPASGWCGLYFVDAGTEVPDAPDNGVIEFCDPRNSFRDRIAVRPTDGLMLLFPSWLQHFVNPYVGERECVSIGFHVALENS